MRIEVLPEQIKKALPYGSWASPITADLIVDGGLSLSDIKVDGDDIYWLEGRPGEDGRSVVVCRPFDGEKVDVIPTGFDVRTMVHEYGGGSYTVAARTVYFSNCHDQRIYRVRDGASPEALTSLPKVARSHRYADFVISPKGGWLCSIRERHQPQLEPTNDLVALSIDEVRSPHVLASGYDFYSSPRFNIDGTRICWICWNHPNMPWDGCELWVADFSQAGSLSNETRVAGSKQESIVQPEWAACGDLYFVSDASGWWNLSVWDGQITRPFLQETVDHSQPAWQFGYSSYGFSTNGSVVLGADFSNSSTLRCFSNDGKELTGLSSGHSTARYVTIKDDHAFFVGSSVTSLPEIVSINMITGIHSIVQRSSTLELDITNISKPQSIAFPTNDNKQAYGFYYPPWNAQACGKEREKPPLLVISHGGPTGAAIPDLNLRVQFWTSRGFAVVDVDYRGSTGYGRSYRDALKPMWGIVDTADCIAAADFLVEQGLADKARLAIRGSSAGGYTAINALTFHNRFAVGATYYGVTDLKALVDDTHKFESRYLDGLIGPYPEARLLYHDRSAIHYTDRLESPMIIFQGLEDAIVPPSQAELMASMLRKKGIPFACLYFDDEQHGFRKAKNIKRCLEAELYFYGRVLKFWPSDNINPISIENADNLPD